MIFWLIDVNDADTFPKLKQYPTGGSSIYDDKLVPEEKATLELGLRLIDDLVMEAVYSKAFSFIDKIGAAAGECEVGRG